ncbi:hypothetical protein [Mycolicibacterium sp.]|uniref:hypothetical protein n=1 Tax=Mycolicibacterium sp. TaxID=2320850 RepID=UPI00355EC696
MSASIEELWPIPQGLCADGQVAAQTIRELLDERKRGYHGGGGKFYTPQQWQDRGESYGTTSLLVITHDGGDHAGAFNLDYGDYKFNEELMRRLRDKGMFAEACTGWYSAIYRS